MNLSTVFVKHILYVEASELQLVILLETWGLFKSRREIFWASAMMVSSSKQFVHSNKCTSMFIKYGILATSWDSVLLADDG